MSDDAGDISQAYESVAWRALMLALLAQVMVPAPDDEDECAKFLRTVLSDILDQTVNSDAMPAELDRSALWEELEQVNDKSWRTSLRLAPIVRRFARPICDRRIDAQGTGSRMSGSSLW